MNIEKIFPDHNRADKLNIIEEAISRAEARKQSHEISDPYLEIDPDFQSELNEMAPTSISKTIYPGYRLRLQFATIGIICAILGAAIMWGLVQPKAQTKVDQPIINSISASETPDPSWSGLKMSYQVARLIPEKSEVLVKAEANSK